MFDRDFLIRTLNIWSWLDTKELELHRFQPLVPLTKVPNLVRCFERQAYASARVAMFKDDSLQAGWCNSMLRWGTHEPLLLMFTSPHWQEAQICNPPPQAVRFVCDWRTCNTPLQIHPLHPRAVLFEKGRCLLCFVLSWSLVAFCFPCRGNSPIDSSNSGSRLLRIL